jgi:hypothetical protein
LQEPDAIAFRLINSINRQLRVSTAGLLTFGERQSA